MLFTVKAHMALLTEKALAKTFKKSVLALKI